MAAFVQKGDCVYVFTIYLDVPKSGNPWSRLFLNSRPNYDSTNHHGNVFIYFLTLQVKKVKKKVIS